MPKYTTYTVLLADGTVGEIRSSSLKHPGQPWVKRKLESVFTTKTENKKRKQE